VTSAFARSDGRPFIRQKPSIRGLGIIDELGAIAFSDIGDVVVWDQNVKETPTKAGYPDGRVVPVITSRVTVRPSATMDPAVRRAISSPLTMLLSRHTRRRGRQRSRRAYYRRCTRPERPGRAPLSPGQIAFLCDALMLFGCTLDAIFELAAVVR
jgi:hypothetical protein